MKTKPILFSTTMVQAILEGRKTQTRRIIKSIPHDAYKIWFDGGEWIIQNKYYKCWTEKLEPKYKKDDILWVRETFNKLLFNIYAYKADNKKRYNSISWKPSIFMPKEAARIFLKVTNIRVERLHDISENDAIAEGIKSIDNVCYDYLSDKFYRKPYESFCTLWTKINGKESWNQNPFVWVYEFERTEKPKNFL